MWSKGLIVVDWIDGQEDQMGSYIWLNAILQHGMNSIHWILPATNGEQRLHELRRYLKQTQTNRTAFNGHWMHPVMSTIYSEKETIYGLKTNKTDFVSDITTLHILEHQSARLPLFFFLLCPSSRFCWCWTPWTGSGAAHKAEEKTESEQIR